MFMFDLDNDTMVNMESISYIKFATIENQKTVVVGVGGQSFIVPISRHKEFFESVVRLGVSPTKQFVSV